jgi:hypothetical protein
LSVLVLSCVPLHCVLFTYLVLHPPYARKISAKPTTKKPPWNKEFGRCKTNKC